MSSLRSHGDFPSTDRFAVRRRLGAGGMGVVFSALDKERGIEVALKTLKVFNATALYRFKREFRALADVAHRNLVSLEELFSEGDEWFFTMELVEGQTFFDYVIIQNPGPPTEPDEQPTEVELELPDTAEDLGETKIDRPTLQKVQKDHLHASRINFDRLRVALRQLAEGLSALHDSGKLHRDVKPSNVLVTPDDRVVILDFGLVHELETTNLETMTEQGLAGTVAYMAPEQGTKTGLTSASDWFSVGVMLYEILTGQLPFPGHGLEMHLNKMRMTPRRPSELVAGLPRDIESLCMDLLRQEPSERPSGTEVLTRLGAVRASAALSASSSIGDGMPFVGRAPHLAALESAYAAVKGGAPVTVFVRGASGIGKSALVKKFLDKTKKRENPVILTGRCYERESVPFKAVDSLIDSLSHYLARLTPTEVTALLPRSIGALSRVFPVLERVEAVAQASQITKHTPDQQELRRRAFIALRELLTRISDRGDVILFIDDLQWGDADSAALLTDLVRPPEAPPILLIASFRSEEENNPILKSMLRHQGQEGVDSRTVTVGALPPDQARNLALFLLSRGGGPQSEAELQAEKIALESRGNAFFIETMARYVERAPQTTTAELRLDAVLKARLSRVEPNARSLLEMIAVAGKPMEESLLAGAAGLEPKARASAIDLLRASKLVRSSRQGHSRTLEAYHDRIRRSLLEDLSPESLKSRHLELARALEAANSSDSEALYEHFLEGGDTDRAAEHAIRAADQATSALAFDRASSMYRVAIKLKGDALAAEEKRELQARAAAALANAGRGSEAAESFLEASKGAPDTAALNWKRLAAEQYLVSGHINKGLNVLKDVLAKTGMRLAESPRQAYRSRMLKNAQLWKHGLGFRERAIAEADPDSLTKIDVLWSVSSGLNLVDYIRGADFQGRHLLLALKTGEPYRVLRAIAMEASYSAALGAKALHRTHELTDAAETLAKRLNRPHAVLLSTLASAISAHLNGDWGRSLPLLEKAEALTRDTCTGANWEIATARTFLHGALYHLGRISDLSRRVSMLMDEAEARGDLFQATEIRIGHSNVVWLAADNPERARRLADEAMTRWTSDSYSTQHYFAGLARANVLIYTGRGTEALSLVQKEWPALQASMLLKTQYVWLNALHLRARAAIAAAEEDPSRKDELLHIAEHDAAQLKKEGDAWSVDISRLLQASIAMSKARISEATKDFREVIPELEKKNLLLLATAAKLRLGQLVRGAEGADLASTARSKMSYESIRNPELFAAMLIPGGSHS